MTCCTISVTIVEWLSTSILGFPDYGCKYIRSNEDVNG